MVLKIVYFPGATCQMIPVPWNILLPFSFINLKSTEWLQYSCIVVLKIIHSNTMVVYYSHVLTLKKQNEWIYI